MEFDYISSRVARPGCVAARLSEDPAISVALIEAGGQNDGLCQRVPTGRRAADRQTNERATGIFDRSAVGIKGAEGINHAAAGLGGSSALNAMIYLRGTTRGYDEWAKGGAAGMGRG